MGLIRLLLALAVVGSHMNSHPLLKFVGGEVAVQTFFVISGFYMAMIFNSYKSKKEFWISRFLRLYPLYIVCATASLIGSLIVLGSKEYFAKIGDLPIPAIVFLVFTNATIFFQDITMFLGVQDRNLLFVSNFYNSTPPLYQLLLIPQGWTLGIEFSFYILAPFLLTKNNRTLLVVFLVSQVTRMTLISMGYSSDPWSHRFFPSELSTFLLGSLSFRFYKTYTKNLFNTNVSNYIFSFILFFILAFGFIPLDFQTKKNSLLILFTISIASIFNVTKYSKFDNFMGKLSYPIYVCHIILINVNSEINLLVLDGKFNTTVMMYTIIIGFSIVLYFLIDRPVDLFRKRFKQKSRR